MSEETKKKLSKVQKGMKRPPRTEEYKEKISLANRGRKHSKITRKKMSEIRLSKNIRGKNHPQWQGGKSFEPYTTDWTETLRRSIRERDRYICQLCDSYGNAVHHIDYDKKNCDPRNLINLCVSCNSKVNTNGLYWTQYFAAIRQEQERTIR